MSQSKKYLFVSGIQKDTNLMTRSDINSCSSLYSFYLRNYFETIPNTKTYFCKAYATYNKSNHKILMDRYKIIDNSFEDNMFDAIFMLEQKGLYKRPKELSQLLRRKLKTDGLLCCFADNDNFIGYEDILFYTVPSKNTLNQKKLNTNGKSIYIGWAADHNLCDLGQSDDKLQILIDHSLYGENRSEEMERSWDIIPQVLEFAHNSSKNIVVKRFYSGGIEVMDPLLPYNQEIYNRDGLSFDNVCKEYSKTDIFIPTHTESMGLSVLESAIAGAFIYAPRNHINPELLKTLYFEEFDAELDLDKIISKLDHNKSRNMAMEFTWDNFCKKVHNHISQLIHN